MLLDDMEEAERKEYVNEADKNGITPVYLARQKGERSVLYLSICIVACAADVCMSLCPTWQHLMLMKGGRRASRRRKVSCTAASAASSLEGVQICACAWHAGWTGCQHGWGVRDGTKRCCWAVSRPACAWQRR